MFISEEKLIQNVLKYNPSIDVFGLNIYDGDTIKKYLYRRPIFFQFYNRYLAN